MSVQIATFSAIFNWISKQQVNLSLFLLDLYCRKFGLMNLLGYDGKLTSDKKMIWNSYLRYKGENRDPCSHFLEIFEAASISLTVLVRMILGKTGIDRFIRPQRKNKYNVNLVLR